MQHLKQQIMHFVNGFYGIAASYFFLKYSNASLIICIIAMIKAPNAILPIWYLKIHLNPILNEALALSSELPP